MALHKKPPYNLHVAQAWEESFHQRPQGKKYKTFLNNPAVESQTPPVKKNVNGIAEPLLCLNCNKTGSLRCEVCFAVYCSNKCRLDDWFHHSPLCKPPPGVCSLNFEISPVKANKNPRNSPVRIETNEVGAKCSKNLNVIPTNQSEHELINSQSPKQTEKICAPSGNILSTTVLDKEKLSLEVMQTETKICEDVKVAQETKVERFLSAEKSFVSDHSLLEQLKLNEEYEGVVTCQIEEGRFNFSIKWEWTKLFYEQCFPELQSSGQNPSLASVENGSYAAFFSDKVKEWCRAYVSSVDGDMCKVCCIDYGAMVALKKDCLKLLPQNLCSSLPGLSLNAKLIGDNKCLKEDLPEIYGNGSFKFRVIGCKKGKCKISLIDSTTGSDTVHFLVRSWSVNTSSENNLIFKLYNQLFDDETKLVHDSIKPLTNVSPTLVNENMINNESKINVENKIAKKDGIHMESKIAKKKEMKVESKKNEINMESKIDKNDQINVESTIDKKNEIKTESKIAKKDEINLVSNVAKKDQINVENKIAKKDVENKITRNAEISIESKISKIMNKIENDSKLDEKSYVQLVWVTEDNYIYIHILNEDLNLNLQKIQTLLISCSKSSELSVEPKVGDYICAHWGMDEQWYRGVVLQRNGDIFMVRFIDFGNEVTIPLANLRPYIDDLKEIPPCAFKAKLDGISSTDKNANEALLKLFSLDIPFTMEPVQTEPLVIHLYDACNSKILSNFSVKNDQISLLNCETILNIVDQPDKDCQEFFLLKDCQFLELKVDSEEEVLILHVFSSKMIFIAPRLNGNIVQEIIETIEKINEYCNSLEETYYKPCENEVCLVKYDEDGLWYRAYVVSVISDDSGFVLFLDGFVMKKVNFKDVIKIKKEFLQYTVPAVHCLLEGLGSEGIMTSVEERIEELLPAGSCTTVKVIGYDANGTCRITLPLILEALED